MRSKIFIIIFSMLTFETVVSDELFIQAKNISIDKKNNLTIFKDDVLAKTKENYQIKSQYAEFNKEVKNLILKNQVIGIDNNNNKIETDFAEYNEISRIFNTKGFTKVVTSEKYTIEGEDIVFNNYKKVITSSKKALITDNENNKIYLSNFEYQIEKNIFKSLGKVKILDKNQNSYEFNQIYIDTKKKEILGSDAKFFINQDDFKIDERNKPRIFSNTSKISGNKSIFKKSVFTLCNYRKNDKCPPWSIQSNEMLHDNKKKTIYYKNAVIKIYDIPIFYIPKLSHPDPSVERRSGFLVPSFEDTKNLGAGISVPYFFALRPDKNFTLTNKFYASENPLFNGMYHQVFKESNLLADFGYTEGFKKTNSKKKSGNKSHFFSNFSQNLNFDDGGKGFLNIKTQKVSNDKYLKLYKLKSDLIDYNNQTLENSIDYSFENEDLFFGFNSSIYETLKEDYDDKYEYIYPDLTVNKNLINNNTFGSLDLQTNLKVRKYETNKFTNFLINDFSWNNTFKNDSIFKNKIIGNLKNINYETKNVDKFKKDTTNELFGALGYLTQLHLKKENNFSSHLLKPKFLLRYAPGSMRKEEDGNRITPLTAFNMDRLDNINNFETGLSATVGFDYEINENSKKFDFSVAQIISEKENKKMASKTSLDEKLSDLVGSSKVEINEKLDFTYNFSLDQNYKEFNYNEFNSNFNFDPMRIGFGYILENNHIGNQEYFKTKIDYTSSNSLLSFETKRNLISDSSEFYNLSYEYMNDCLRAGLVYRREFYNDSELEPENSLMFKITLTPFGSISSPSVSR